MKVLFLGAGASRPAGYPLAGDLMPVLEQASSRGADLMLRTAWEKWDSFRKRATGGLALMLNHPNPEIVLSQLDLFSLAARQTAGSSFREDKPDEALGQVLSDAEIPDDYWQSKGHKVLWYADEARNRLVDCLENFFRWRHYDDSTEAGRRRRDYLHSLLSGLSPGDAAITLN